MSTINSVETDESRQAGRARAQSLSRLMANVCAAICVLLPAGMMAFWLASPWPTIFAAAGLGDPARFDPTLATRLGALAISLVPIAILVWGLLRIRRTFKAFSAGHFFSESAVEGLRDFALAILVSSLLRPLVGAALTVWLTWNGPAGTRTLSISIGSDVLLAVLFSGTIYILARVMREAIVLADENRQFV